MTHTMRPDDLVDSTVVDERGSKIGKVGTVYLADDTHEPEWVTVRTGMFGQKESFVPLRGASLDSDGLHVQVAKDKVSDAPRIDADGHLSQEESVELYRYYDLPAPRSTMENARRGKDDRQSMAGMQGMGTRSDTGLSNQSGQAPESMTQTGPSGRHAAAQQTGQATGQTTARSGQQAQGQRMAGADSLRGQQRDRSSATAGETMTRSEEQLKVSTEQVETGRVRLRKHVVTEEQRVSVPVSHEEVRIEREPITDGVHDGKAKIGEEEQEVVLHAERPVVKKETVPVERVRIGTEQVTEEQTITDEVRKEQIEVDDDSAKKDRRQH
ncbi:hypothetical protein DI005_20365 [Prauserella sp. PE36]|uniref:DUF2382 domain-containing protein n=1 Tax=Prauserella sp. PE36 TaxID=1504709 RepID=UPI000DE2CF3B|nr:PRC and DUF2382 domain-containing protein [Prauserella sp. PE36]RBM17994.1 hypothetical protein DI005_20365 [Prauserella sp. PE36]